MAYTFNNLIKAYSEVGISSGQTVYIGSDLRFLTDFEDPNPEALPKVHYKAIRKLLGPTGTVVTLTSTINLCNTDKVFDPNHTKGYRVGALSEYIRTLPDSHRSFHPFVSYAANGPLAKEIVSNVSRHAFGPETPQQRLIEMDALAISVGSHPRITLNAVHHVEHMMGVPYRYTKEFLHPVKRGDIIQIEPFYRHVMYNGIGVSRDFSRALMNIIEQDMNIVRVPLSKGSLFCYELKNFYQLATKAFTNDIYIWCRNRPTVFPFRE
jgi:aminoglycoside 3-N-acetyltransferase